MGGEEWFRYVRCEECGLVYLNPRPTPEAIHEFYGGGRYWHGIAELELSPADRPLLREHIAPSAGRIYAGALSRLGQHRSGAGPGRMLDVGCGLGYLLVLFESLGWRCRGVELGEAPARFASQVLGLEVTPGDLLGTELPEGGFDLITFSGVLEHLHEPQRTLEHAARLLAPEGLVMVYVQNWDSLARPLFGRYWYPLDAPRHLTQYTPQTLERALAQAGLELLSLDFQVPVMSAYALKESLRYVVRGMLGRSGNAGAVQGDSPAAGPLGVSDLVSLAETNYSPGGSVAQRVLYRLAWPVAWLLAKLRRGDLMVAFARKRQG